MMSARRMKPCADFDLVDARRMHLVMDKGFYSEDNVDAVYKRRMHFLASIPFTASLSLDAVERHRNDEMISHRHYCCVLGDELYADTELMEWKGHRCHLHIYFDSLKAVLDEKKSSHRILIEYEEFCFGNTVKGKQKDYERFFMVKETPKRGRKVEYKKSLNSWGLP